MEDKYFVIYNYDGDTKIREYTKKELEQKLEDDEFANKIFYSSIPDSDTNYWGENPIIIKGSIIVPKVVEKVIKYQL